MSYWFCSAPCFLAADPRDCCYSRIWRFGISSWRSGAKLGNPSFTRRTVYCGSPCGGSGRTGRKACSSSNPNRSSLGIGWAFACSGVGNPVPAAADPPWIANSSTSFGKCGPAIRVGSENPQSRAALGLDKIQIISADHFRRVATIVPHRRQRVAYIGSREQFRLKPWRAGFRNFPFGLGIKCLEFHGVRGVSNRLQERRNRPPLNLPGEKS
jgi:hypothetical protein